MPSIVLPIDTNLVEIDEDGKTELATEPHAWCLLGAKDDVYLTFDKKNPAWPYVLTFSTIDEVLAFRQFFGI